MPSKKIVIVKNRLAMPAKRLCLQPAAQPQTYAPGQSLPGGFVIDEVVAEGGSGIVLKAHKQAIHPPIYKAIKVVNTRCLDKDFHRADDVKKEFYGEAKVSFEIGSDPYAISVEDILDMPDGSKALVCPFIKGHTLGALIRDHRRRGWLLPFELTAFVFHRILSVLSHAQECGIAHRDLCTNNIMIQRTGVPLVLDWGAAGELDESVFVGKPGYMAPEIIRQSDAVSGAGLFKADIFSLGAVIREMLIGRNALEYMDPMLDGYEAYAALAYRETLDSETLPSVAGVCQDVPTLLSNIVYTCMKEDPDERPQAEDLYEYLGAEYLYTSQIGFGPTAETLRDYLEFFYSSYDPLSPLPDNRFGRSLEKLICAKFRRKAELPENRGTLLRDIVARANRSFTLGHVARTLEEAFGPGSPAADA